MCADDDDGDADDGDGIDGDDDSSSEERVSLNELTQHLRAYCKQKARHPKAPSESDQGESAEGEESGNEVSTPAGSSCEEEDVSGASESADVGLSGFLDDEAMEVELSSEEWEEGSSPESEGCGSDEGEGFVVSEAMDEEVYQARKRRVRVLSDSESGSESERLVPKTRRTRTRHDEFLEDEEESGSGLDADPALCSSEEDASVGAGSGDDGEGVAPSKGSGLSLRWKQDLSLKASQAYAKRSSSAANLHRLIYSATPTPGGVPDADSDDDAREGIGGLFQLTKKKAVSIFHKEDSSYVCGRAPSSRDWTAPNVTSAVKPLFVTGNWGAEGAQAMLDEDDALYGDFEDMEEGGVEPAEAMGGVEEVEEGGDADTKEAKRSEKKKKKKAAFDVGYDEEGGGGDYLDDLKREVSEQEQRNRAEFEGMDERARLQYEGVRPGYYVRVELKSKNLHLQGGGCKL